MPTIKVLYITGWCRNGSTLLGNILGEAEGFLHVGELGYLWRNAVGQGTNRTCGCRRELLACDVWSRVLAAASADGLSPAENARRIEEARTHAVRTRHTLSVLGRVPSRAREAYGAALARTYRAISDVTGARVIVDSGKLPAEAALLLRAEGIVPRYVHLVRDARATACSWARSKDYVPSMPAWRSTGYWVGFNLASRALAQVHPDGVRFLRYEDFLRDPERTVKDLLAFAGEAHVANPVVGRTVTLRPNHTVTGNPDRFNSGPTEVRAADVDWRHQLDLSTRLLVTGMSLPLLAGYGYLRDGDAAASRR